MSRDVGDCRRGGGSVHWRARCGRANNELVAIVAASPLEKISKCRVVKSVNGVTGSAEIAVQPLLTCHGTDDDSVGHCLTVVYKSHRGCLANRADTRRS